MKVYKLEMCELKDTILFSSIKVAEREILLYLDTDKFEDGEICPLTQTEPGIWTSPNYPDVKIGEIEFP